MMRTVGFQAVLERGVLSYYNSRADALAGVKRKDYKYLDGAQGVSSDLTLSTFTVMFSDGTIHHLSVPIASEDVTGELTRMVGSARSFKQVAGSIIVFIL